MAWRVQIGCFNSLKVKQCGRKIFSLIQFMRTAAVTLIKLFIFLFHFLTLIIVQTPLFLLVSILHKFSKILYCPLFSKTLTSIFCMWWVLYLILLCGDIEINPGHNKVKIMHWNLNSISTDNFCRKTLIESYNFTENYDVIAITESNIHANVPDEDLAIEGYTVRRRDLPIDTYYGGIIVYVKSDLPFRERPDLEGFSNQLILEINFANKKILCSINYRKHHHDDNTILNNYLTSLDRTFDKIKSENPFCSVYIGDFNAHHSQWCPTDTTDNVGDKLQCILEEKNLFQLVNEPTHIMPNSQTCIDLVITDRPDLATKCEIRPSLHTRCHHQINHVELNIINPPPPTFYRKIWHYNRADIQRIQKAILSVNWERELLVRVDNPNEQVKFFTETLMNIFSNYIPNKLAKIKKRELPWFNKRVRSLYKRFKFKFDKYRKRGFPQSMSEQVEKFKTEYTDAVLESKEDFLRSQGHVLNDPSIHPKKYWSILKRLTSVFSFPNIPPILINNTFISDFTHKAEIFNNYFATICTVLDTGSQIPVLSPLTNSLLTEFPISRASLFLIIKNLNPNKSHGFDQISVRMIKLCGETILDPFMIILQNCLNKGFFPDMWKKANVNPIFKKNEKFLVKNYRPISLLPIFGKIFEKIIFDTLYNYFIENNLITEKQSGFMKGDSTIYQLLSITQMIRKSFDCVTPLEVRGIFLDISKAFDKVWHAGLVFKLKQNGISGKALKLLTHFLNNRFQRTLLNGQHSSWKPIEAGVPQGSVLGPLLFLIYINDLVIGLKCDIRIFADDTSLFKIVRNIDTAYEDIQHDLNLIQQWGHQWKMSFNPDPTKPPVEVIFSTKRNPGDHPVLTFNGLPLQRQDETKHLGLILDKKLKFNTHITTKIKESNRLVGTLKLTREYIPVKSLEMVYKSFIRSKIEYADVIFHSCSLGANLRPDPFSLVNRGTLMDKIEQVQYKSALAVTGMWQGSNREKMYAILGWEYLSKRRWSRQMAIFYKITKGIAPSYLQNEIILSNANAENGFRIPAIRNRKQDYTASFFPSSIYSWNNILSIEDKKSPSINSFKIKLSKKIKPEKVNNFGLFFVKDIKFLNQLRVGLSLLSEHKFRHNFLDCPQPFCICGLDEDTFHFLCKCPIHVQPRNQLYTKIIQISNLNPTLMEHNDLLQLLLYGDPSLTANQNKLILEAVNSFISNTNRFIALNP